MTELLEKIRKTRLYLDGGMGTMLYKMGLEPGELTEGWNLTHKAEIISVHKKYYEAGSNIICANTFGINGLKYSEERISEMVSGAVECANEARRLCKDKENKYIALDIGPLGRMLKPYGDVDFEDAVEAFAKTVRAGVKFGVDLIFIETMNDGYETKAAVLAAKENSGLPVFVSNAYEEDGKLINGSSPEAIVALLEGLGADAIGVNCSFGPDKLLGVVERLVAASSLPVFAKPNAGLPESVDGETVYNITAEKFAGEMIKMAKIGACMLGGCCGTDPEYIEKTVAATKDIPLAKIEKKNYTVVSSFSRTVRIGERPILIGERINPTGKKRFKQALVENDIGYILNEGTEQVEKGADILDVNVGLPGIDEKKMLEKAVSELQAVESAPLQIDTSDFDAMEKALRIYNGKAMINSVNGKEESLRKVFPLVKKYGGVCVALTLDDNGIPSTAEGRVEIAKKILRAADEYGIDKKDIVFDTLCMAASADITAPGVTLDALKIIHDELKMNTVLGVSNISFGLPQRDTVNSAFFAMALENGLSAAIINPYSTEMMKTYYSYMMLRGMDKDCKNYIGFSESIPVEKPVGNIQKAQEKPKDQEGTTELRNAIIKGFRERAAELSAKELLSADPMSVINDQIIPALDVVGKGFEKKTVYLPQLLMSAEAAKAAFEKVKEAVSASGRTENKRAKFVIATVKGDIHDIGKNIVKALLENYGFQTIDLGKDVDPETVVETVLQEKAPLCGLSALMTTTVVSMEKTVKLLKEKAPWCKVVVGGAALTKEYAEKIGADKYAKDAMETVRYAEETEKYI